MQLKWQEIVVMRLSIAFAGSVWITRKILDQTCVGTDFSKNLVFHYMRWAADNVCYRNCRGNTAQMIWQLLGRIQAVLTRTLWIRIKWKKNSWHNGIVPNMANRDSNTWTSNYTISWTWQIGSVPVRSLVAYVTSLVRKVSKIITREMVTIQSKELYDRIEYIPQLWYTVLWRSYCQVCELSPSQNSSSVRSSEQGPQFQCSIR